MSSSCELLTNNENNLLLVSNIVKSAACHTGQALSDISNSTTDVSMSENQVMTTTASPVVKPLKRPFPDCMNGGGSTSLLVASGESGSRDLDAKRIKLSESLEECDHHHSNFAIKTKKLSSKEEENEENCSKNEEETSKRDSDAMKSDGQNVACGLTNGYHPVSSNGGDDFTEEEEEQKKILADQKDGIDKANRKAGAKSANGVIEEETSKSTSIHTTKSDEHKEDRSQFVGKDENSSENNTKDKLLGNIENEKDNNRLARKDNKGDEISSGHVMEEVSQNVVNNSISGTGKSKNMIEDEVSSSKVQKTTTSCSNVNLSQSSHHQDHVQIENSNKNTDDESNNVNRDNCDKLASKVHSQSSSCVNNVDIKMDCINQSLDKCKEESILSIDDSGTVSKEKQNCKTDVFNDVHDENERSEKNDDDLKSTKGAGISGSIEATSPGCIDDLDSVVKDASGNIENTCDEGNENAKKSTEDLKKMDKEVGKNTARCLDIESTKKTEEELKQAETLEKSLLKEQEKEGVNEENVGKDVEEECVDKSYETVDEHGMEIEEISLEEEEEEQDIENGSNIDEDSVNNGPITEKSANGRVETARDKLDLVQKVEASNINETSNSQIAVEENFKEIVDFEKTEKFDVEKRSTVTTTDDLEDNTVPGKSIVEEESIDNIVGDEKLVQNKEEISDEALCKKKMKIDNNEVIDKEPSIENSSSKEKIVSQVTIEKENIDNEARENEEEVKVVPKIKTNVNEKENVNIEVIEIDSDSDTNQESTISPNETKNKENCSSTIKNVQQTTELTEIDSNHSKTCTQVEIINDNDCGLVNVDEKITDENLKIKRDKETVNETVLEVLESKNKLLDNVDDTVRIASENVQPSETNAQRSADSINTSIENKDSESVCAESNDTMEIDLKTKENVNEPDNSGKLDGLVIKKENEIVLDDVCKVPSATFQKKMGELDQVRDNLDEINVKDNSSKTSASESGVPETLSAFPGVMNTINTEIKIENDLVMSESDSKNVDEQTHNVSREQSSMESHIVNTNAQLLDKNTNVTIKLEQSDLSVKDVTEVKLRSNVNSQEVGSVKKENINEEKNAEKRNDSIQVENRDSDVEMIDISIDNDKADKKIIDFEKEDKSDSLDKIGDDEMNENNENGSKLVIDEQKSKTIDGDASSILVESKAFNIHMTKLSKDVTKDVSNASAREKCSENKSILLKDVEESASSISATTVPTDVKDNAPKELLAQVNLGECSEDDNGMNRHENSESSMIDPLAETPLIKEEDVEEAKDNAIVINSNEGSKDSDKIEQLKVSEPKSIDLLAENSSSEEANQFERTVEPSSSKNATEDVSMSDSSPIPNNKLCSIKESSTTDATDSPKITIDENDGAVVVEKVVDSSETMEETLNESKTTSATEKEIPSTNVDETDTGKLVETTLPSAADVTNVDEEEDDDIIFIKECKKGSDCTCVMCYKNESTDKKEEDVIKGKSKKPKISSVMKENSNEGDDSDAPELIVPDDNDELLMDVEEEEEKKKAGEDKKDVSKTKIGPKRWTMLKNQLERKSYTKEAVERLFKRHIIEAVSYKHESSRLRHELNESQAAFKRMEEKYKNSRKEMSELRFLFEQMMNKMSTLEKNLGAGVIEKLLPIPKITRSVGLSVNLEARPKLGQQLLGKRKFSSGSSNATTATNNNSSNLSSSPSSAQRINQSPRAGVSPSLTGKSSPAMASVSGSPTTGTTSTMSPRFIPLPSSSPTSSVRARTPSPAMTAATGYSHLRRVVTTVAGGGVQTRLVTTMTNGAAATGTTTVGAAGRGGSLRGTISSNMVGVSSTGAMVRMPNASGRIPGRGGLQSGRLPHHGNRSGPRSHGRFSSPKAGVGSGTSNNVNVVSPLRQTTAASSAVTTDSVDIIDLDDDDVPQKVSLACSPNVIANRPGVQLRVIAPRSQAPRSSITTTTGRVYVPTTDGYRLRGPAPGRLVGSSPSSSGSGSSLTYVLETSGGLIPFRTENNVRLNLTSTAISGQPTIRINKATHPAPLPPTPSPPTNMPPEHKKKASPLPPELRVALATSGKGIQLTWTLEMDESPAKIESFEVFAYQESKNSVASTSLWKTVGKLDALPLPMACTLTQFTEGNNYYFIVRAIDEFKRYGPFSNIGRIHLNTAATAF